MVERTSGRIDSSDHTIYHELELRGNLVLCSKCYVAACAIESTIALEVRANSRYRQHNFRPLTGDRVFLGDRYISSLRYLPRLEISLNEAI